MGGNASPSEVASEMTPEAMACWGVSALQLGPEPLPAAPGRPCQRSPVHMYSLHCCSQDDHHGNYDSKGAMEKLVAQTHYQPRKWKEPHHCSTRDDVLDLYRYRWSIFFQVPPCAHCKHTC